MSVYILKDDGLTYLDSSKENYIAYITNLFSLNSEPDFVITKKELFDKHGIFIPIEEYKALESVPFAQNILILNTFIWHFKKQECKDTARQLFKTAMGCGTILGTSLGAKTTEWLLNSIDLPSYNDNLAGLFSSIGNVANFAMPLSICGIIFTALLYGKTHVESSMAADKLTLDICGNYKALREVIKSSDYMKHARLNHLDACHKKNSSEQSIAH